MTAEITSIRWGQTGIVPGSKVTYSPRFKKYWPMIMVKFTEDGYTSIWNAVTICPRQMIHTNLVMPAAPTIIPMGKKREKAKPKKQNPS